jgi:dienelactone hydrolase
MPTAKTKRIRLKPCTAKTARMLQPATGLWGLYHPERAPYRFTPRALPAARAWQKAVAPELGETIGFQDRPRLPFNPTLLERVDMGGYVREKLVIQTAPATAMPFYLLTPKAGARPLPVVLALHGHGYGVKDILGMWETGKARHTPDGAHRDFGLALVRRGFAVVAPEISCFGERQTDFSAIKRRHPASYIPPHTCEHTAHLALHLGGSALGLRVRDGRRLLDYLEQRRDPALDLRRLGAMGLSGGGMHTLFSTALDRRIKACVISGYFSTFRDSILTIAHCPCNFAPGLGRFGEMADVAGLIAPRPILIEAATWDEIFPIAAVRKGLARLRQIYRVFGAQADVEADIFEGRHRISGARAYDFLWEKLA